MHTMLVGETQTNKKITDNSKFLFYFYFFILEKYLKQFSNHFIMRLGKKISGGRYHSSRKKKKHELVRPPRIVKLKETKKKTIRTRGGNNKTVLLGTNKVNVIDTKTKKSKLVAVKNVLETPSNIFLARQNILTKGAIVETEIGKVKITNRPGQEGSAQGILIE